MKNMRIELIRIGDFTLTFPSRRVCRRAVPVIPDVVLSGLDFRKPTLEGLGVELDEE